jgi:haloacetate dehalogenase
MPSCAAAAWWHWFCFGQTDNPAERLISADPEAWYRPSRERMGEANYADYLRAIHDPEMVHALLEDYRAGLRIDRAHDEAHRSAGRRVESPVLVHWATEDDLEELYGDPLEVWRAWADDLRGGRLECGHHMADEAPEALAGELSTFLRAVRA